jgi:hypothetical protein
VLRARSDTVKESETLVLRPRARRAPTPHATAADELADRALITALTRVLPAPRRLGLPAAPATILR